jgi:hypothetical protein
MRLSMASLFIAALLLPSCGDESPGPGRVLVKWEIMGLTCGAVGVTQVKVTLEQEGQAILTDGATCADGELVISDVPADTYDVRVLGYNEDDHATHEGFYSGLVVEPGDTPSQPEVIIKLKQRPGRILLGWSFPEQPGTPCTFIGVSKIEVFVFRADNPASPEFAGDFPCDPGYEDPANLPAPIENGFVAIGGLPNGEMMVNLFGRNELDDRTYKGSETLMVPMGGDVQVMVDLTKCNKECD